VPASDRARKTAFADIDLRKVREEVARLPITTWSCKSDDETIRHIGPMSQDFYAAFNIGYDDKHIGTIDESGVALAAIQGLNAKVESALDEKNRRLDEQSATIREQQRQLAELSDRLQRAETLAAEVAALKAALAELQRPKATVAIK